MVLGDGLLHAGLRFGIFCLRLLCADGEVSIADLPTGRFSSPARSFSVAPAVLVERVLPPLRLAAKGRGERGAARTLPVRAIAMGTNGCCGRLENPGVFRTHGSWWHCLHTRYARGIFCPRSTTVNRPASSHTRYHRDTRGTRVLCF